VVKTLEGLAIIIRKTKDFTNEAISIAIKGWIIEKEYSFGSVMQPARLAIVGDLKGVDLYVIIAFIGKEEAIFRLNKLQNFISCRLK